MEEASEKVMHENVRTIEHGFVWRFLLFLGNRADLSLEILRVVGFQEAIRLPIEPF